MATNTTITSASAWSPDVQGFAPDQAIPGALINSITFKAGTVEGDDVAVRVPLVTDDAAYLVPEGDVIPEGADTLAEAVVLTTKVAKLLRLSREQFTQPNASANLSMAAGRAIIAKADDVLLNQTAPVAPAIIPPAGLLAQITASAGAVATNLDELVDALATIEANGGTPSHIVLSPSAWGSLRKFKAATGSAQTILGTGAADAQRVLLDLPVIVNRAMVAGSGLIVDASDIASVVGNVMVAQSDHAYFTSDSVALRVTFRFGATVMHANRHSKFTVTAP